jgi:hypothetical protein
MRMAVRNPLRESINLLRCLIHPFDTFYAVKEEGKGSLAQAGIVVLVFFFATIMRRQNTGYSFNYNDLSDLNIWLIGAKTIALFGLWVVSNWAVATWMDGEGKAAQIVIVSAYAIVPYVASLIVTMLLSNVLLAEEGVFLHYLTVVAMLWSAVLMMIGLQTIHDYGFVRNLQAIALTIVAMGIIVFLGTLFYTLFQQAYVFIYTIYSEALFRY